MHRAVRVGEYWNWLPAFRAVAETSSLRDAAKRIHVAPSAISRTVRLLEESLGRSLFDRTGSAMTLNASGRELLDAVRAAMRLVNDVQGAGPREAPCHIHCPTDVVTLLMDALDSWLSLHPGAPPLVHTPCAEDVAAQLLRGDLDVALQFEPATHAGVTSALLGEISSSLYVAPSHPASRLKRVTAHDLGTLPFIDYPVYELSFLRVMHDAEKQRVAYVPAMELAVRLCALGRGLACVPDFVAAASGIKLVALPWDLPRARLYAWFRRPLGDLTAPLIVQHLAAQPVWSTLVRSRPSASAASSARSARSRTARKTVRSRG